MLNIPKVGQRAEETAAPSLSGSLDAAMTASDPKTVKLKKPIRTHNGEARELKLRDPVASDFMTIGQMPVSVKGSGEDAQLDVDFKLAGKWVSALTGHDELVIGQLSAADWFETVGKVNALLLASGVGGDVGN